MDVKGMPVIGLMAVLVAVALGLEALLERLFPSRRKDRDS